MYKPGVCLRVLGLCALALTIMTVGASGAQGAAAWLVLEGLTVTEGIGGEVITSKDTAITLHSKVSGITVDVLCTEVNGETVLLSSSGRIAKGAQLNLIGCIVDLNGKPAADCEPIDGSLKGVVLSSLLEGGLVLHELAGGTKDELLELLPVVAGSPLWTIQMSKLCSIGTKVPVLGKLYLKDCENAMLVHRETHLFEEGPLTELFFISKTEEHKASFLGSFFAKVDVFGVFRPWAGHAG
jgi:hypothetical protein